MAGKKRNVTIRKEFVVKGLKAVGSNISQIWRKLDALEDDDPRRIDFRSFRRCLQNGEMNNDVLLFISQELGIDPRYFKGTDTKKLPAEMAETHTHEHIIPLRNIKDVPKDLQGIYKREHLIDEDGYIIPSFWEYEMDQIVIDEHKKADLMRKHLYQYLVLAGEVGIIDFGKKHPFDEVHFDKDHVSQYSSYYFDEIQKNILKVYYSIQNKDEDYQQYENTIIIPEELKEKIERKENK